MLYLYLCYHRFHGILWTYWTYLISHLCLPHNTYHTFGWIKLIGQMSRLLSSHWSTLTVALTPISAQERWCFLAPVIVTWQGTKEADRSPELVCHHTLRSAIPPSLADIERHQRNHEEHAEESRATDCEEEDVSEIPFAGGAAFETGDVVLYHHHC